MNSKENRTDQAAALADTIGLASAGTDRGGSAPSMQALRHQASEIREKMTASSAEDLRAMPPETTLQLLHDIQTRQIELESRIEELNQAQTAMLRQHPDRETVGSGLQLLSIVLDALPIGVSITDTKGGSIMANAAFERVWGGPRPETRSVADYGAYKAWWDSTGQPVAPEEWASTVAIQKGVSAVGQIMRLQRFDGSEIFVINSASPIYDNRGVIVGSAVAIQDITAMKHAELALRQKDEDFARAQAVGSIGSWRLDIRRNELIWSDEVYRIFGIPAGTPLTYETYLARIHPQDRAHVHTCWKEGLSGKPYDVEHRIVVDDRIKWVREKAYLEFDKDNELIGGFGITQDISDRKLVEEALRRSEERYRLLAETMLQGVVHQDADGRIIAMNPAAEHILGKSPEEFLNITSVDTEHHTIREDGAPYPGLEHPSMIALRSGKPVRNVVMGVFNPRLGDYRWIRIDAVPVCSQRKDVPIEVYTVFEDITEYREAEAALRKNERTMRTLIDSANESIFLAGLDGEILVANETTARRLGLTVGEFVGKKWQILIPPDLVVSRTAQINEIIRTGRPSFFEDTRNGICFDHSAYPVRDDNGAITAIAFFSRDVTKSKMAEKALGESREQLRVLNNELEQRVERRTRELQEAQRQILHAEKLSAIGKLSASIAHEFNNPLQGIQSVLNGLKKRAILEEEDRELLEEAINESNRIKDLIRSLQEFNRPTSGTMKLIDLHKVLDSMLLLQKSDFRKKRISVARDYAERLPQIQAVSDQIRQVFLNLLTNAADACQERGGVITVRTWQENEETVAVAIKDTGVGIEPEAMDRIFQPFYTTKPEIKGTGLGLSVCYGIVNNHGGEICVDSQPGNGSTFTILLPIKDGAAV